MNENMHEEHLSSRNKPIYNNVTAFKIFNAASALLVGSVGAVCFSLYCDTHSMYLESTPLAYAFYALLALACIGALIFAFLPSGGDETLRPIKQRPALFFGTLSGLPLIYVLVATISEVTNSSVGTQMIRQSFAKDFLIIVISLIAITYFVGILRARTAAHTVLGIFSAIWCLIVVTLTYFDYGTVKLPVNSPYELICQFGMASAMMFIISELRLDLGGVRIHAYKLATSMTFILNFTAVAMGVALFMKGRTDLGLYSLPALAMLLYSAKTFFLTSERITADEAADATDAEHPEASAEIEALNDTEQSDERTQTDENVN